jgi:hypothetical protein
VEVLALAFRLRNDRIGVGASSPTVATALAVQPTLSKNYLSHRAITIVALFLTAEARSETVDMQYRGPVDLDQLSYIKLSR